MNDFAPILIPTLNRYVHFKRCVDSLLLCTHADKTNLFIFLDYPLRNDHWDGYRLIENYLPDIKGFKAINVIKRERNYGAIDNYLESIEYVFERYDRLIFSEDDNEFSPNFLDYINKGLAKFENDENVLAISGYSNPIQIPSSYTGNYYKQRRLAAWGFGTWKHKWANSYYKSEDLIKYAAKMSNLVKLYKRSPGHLAAVLSAIDEGKDLYGDLAIGVHMTINDTLRCINPTISKVRNHGHDGTGLHCVICKNDKFKLQPIDEANQFDYIESKQRDYLIQDELRKIFRMNSIGNLRILKSVILFKLRYFGSSQ